MLTSKSEVLFMYVTCMFMVLTRCQNFSEEKYKQKKKNKNSAIQQFMS